MKKYNEEEDISVRDIYEASNIASNRSEHIENGKITDIIHSSYDASYYLIEKFVEDAINTSEPPFKFIWLKNRLKLQAGNIAKNFQSISNFIGRFEEKKYYSENVQLFFDCCKKNNIGYLSLRCNPIKFLDEFQKTGAAVFNSLVEDIRSIANTPAFKKRVSARKQSCLRNYKSADIYVKELFKKYSRILVMRIDLGFRNDHPEKPNEITLDEAQKYFTIFLNNLRHTEIYKNQVGYIWKLEVGKEKGYHFHLMFFYNGALSQKDYYIADQIGKYWIKVTEGVGIFYNCNASKNKYRNCGIGMVAHDDDVMHKNLYLALRYLFKKDQFLSEKFKLRTRVYGRGKLPKPRLGGAGRPRRN